MSGVELPALEADMVISSHKHSDHYAPSMVSVSSRTPGFDIMRIACFHDEAEGANRGRNYITVIESEGLRVAHLGDIGHQLSENQLEKLGKIDIMLLPIGGTYTLNADEAAELVKSTQPFAVVPMHYLRNGIGFDCTRFSPELYKALRCYQNARQYLGNRNSSRDHKRTLLRQAHTEIKNTPYVKRSMVSRQKKVN